MTEVSVVVPSQSRQMQGQNKKLGHYHFLPYYLTSVFGSCFPIHDTTPVQPYLNRPTLTHWLTGLPPPIQPIPGARGAGSKANPSPPSCAEAKNACSYTSTPPHVYMVWCLNKHRDNFTFALQNIKLLNM
jgi:hypothetical protein